MFSVYVHLTLPFSSLMTGLGFGLMYIPAVVAVAEHFNRRRSLAIGQSTRQPTNHISDGYSDLQLSDLKPNPDGYKKGHSRAAGSHI